MHKIMFFFIVFLTLGSEVWGKDRFAVQGNTLIYNSDAADSEDEQEITDADVGRLKKILKENPQIKKIHLTSGGGPVDTAYEMVEIITNYNLDTHIDTNCESACTLLFLAGKRRTASRQAKLGFHQTGITPEESEAEYLSMREEMDWKTPFDYASWAMESDQDMIYRDLVFYLSRKLSLDFVAKTLEAYSDEMWYPEYSYLVKEGVITGEK